MKTILPLFAELFSDRCLRAWSDSQDQISGLRGFYRRIFSPRVTLWYLIFQRLNADKTQDAVVKDLKAGGADRLSPSRSKALSRKVRSEATTSYNDARQRMPLEFLRWALGKIGAYAQKAFRVVALAGRSFQLLDGSTAAMLCNPAVAQDYPPGRNQHGCSDWCLMRVVVGFCAVSGVVLSAIEGSILLSEQALSWSLMAQALVDTVWIADRNFGVWSVVAQALHHHQDVIVRLTQARAKRLTRRRQWVSGQDEIIQWHRTKHDQIAPGTADVLVQGRLIYVRVCREGHYVDLWLFTTLLDREAFPVSRLLELYSWRWQVELDFRYVKTALDMQLLAVQSAAMARKEFYAGLIAYNLVRLVMATAEQPQGDHPASGLSFSQVRRLVVHWLADWGRDWRSRRGSLGQKFQCLLDQVAEQRLPTRRKPRPNEPRRARRRPATFPLLRGSRQAARKRMLSPE
jgi:hypothetical protein